MSKSNQTIIMRRTGRFAVVINVGVLIFYPRAPRRLVHALDTLVFKTPWRQAM